MATFFGAPLLVADGLRLLLQTFTTSVDEEDDFWVIGVKAVKLHNKRTGLDSDYPTQGVFFAIGHQPNTQIFKGKVEMNDVGYIQVADPSTKTNVPGVFACGAAADPIYRQAVTAAGTGCRAAIDAEHWLAELQD